MNSIHNREIANARWMVTHVLTERCNLNCRMCFQKNIRNKKNNELSLQDILAFYQRHKDEILAVNITGGEPFIRQDCMELLENLNSLGFILSINTNGTLITQEIAKKLCNLSRLRSINISVDGSREIHEQIRKQKGIFDKTVNAITLLRDLVRPEVIQINTMLMPENIIELDSHVRFIESIGVKRMELIFPGSYSKEEIDQSVMKLNHYGINDIVIDTAEKEEFRNHTIKNALIVKEIIRNHPGMKITVVPKSFLENTELFLDDTLDTYEISCLKFARKELRINSAGQIVFCDTLRKPITTYNSFLKFSEINECTNLKNLKKAIADGMPCCKRCCKSTGLKNKEFNKKMIVEESYV